MNRRRAARYLAPVAFLAAVTAAVLLIRAGIDRGSPAKSPTTTATTLTQPKHHHKHPKKARVRYYRVQRGETFGSIAGRFGTTVARLEQLNPGIDPSALSIGEKIRVK